MVVGAAADPELGDAELFCFGEELLEGTRCVAMATVGFADAVADVAWVVEAGFGVAKPEGDDADGQGRFRDFDEPGVAGDVLFCGIGREKSGVA